MRAGGLGAGVGGGLYLAASDLDIFFTLRLRAHMLPLCLTKNACADEIHRAREVLEEIHIAHIS